MSYTSIRDIATDGSLMSRITAAAAIEGIDNPESWVNSRMWQFAAQPSWGDKWAYAQDTYQVNANPDLGARDDVISDADILAAVQALKSEG